MSETKPDRCPTCTSNMLYFRPDYPSACQDPYHDLPPLGAAKPETYTDHPEEFTQDHSRLRTDGWKYVGTRCPVQSPSGTRVEMHVVSVPHENGPWEAIYCHTEEQARTIVALADALAEKERLVLELQEARNNDFVAEVATGAEIKERIATLETENASLLKRATEAEAENKKLIAVHVTDGVGSCHQRRIEDGKKIAALLERAEAAERLHDEHCYTLVPYHPSDPECVPPWRQGR